MSLTPEIAVVGGGVAGLGPAWRLARRGRDVALFERDEIGAGASTRAAGMLAPTSEVDFTERRLLGLGRHSLELYPEWVEQLTEATGIDLDYRREGTLIVAVDRDDAEALERLHDYHRRLDLQARRLVGDDARELEPGLAPTVNYALYTPGDHQIDPVAMVQALGRAFVDAGGQLHEHSGVQSVRIGDGGAEGLVLEDGTAVEADHVVLAAGPWTDRIEGVPDEVLPGIRPVRGQMVCVELGDPPIVDHVVRAPDAYLVPKSDGRLLIGSTMEERGFDPRPTAGGIYDILEGAIEAVPAVYDAPLRDVWTGFRPLTLANEPAVGPTRVDGLWLSVGHGRNGILLTPATARGLAEALDTGEPPDYLEPFVPD